MVKPVRKTSNKNPPILSHEFIIQNHADIVSCIAMVFVVGLMVQVTSPMASIFITLHHNVTGQLGDLPVYLPGYKDWACVFFYSLICIIIHAIIQEYGLDKVSKRLHLSKSKLAIFTTSGQLATFYLLSAGWGLDIVLKENIITDFTLLWKEYPAPMPFLFKLYIIIQLAYGFHEIPELYFQKVKKEEWSTKIAQSLAGVALVTVPYFLNFNRLLVSLLVLHHIAELVYHVSQLIQTVDKEEKFTRLTSLVSNTLQIVARLGSIILSFLTLWYGLALKEQQATSQELPPQVGNYNRAPIRLAVLGGILLLQMYLIFKVINQEINKSKENAPSAPVPKVKVQKKEKPKKSKKSDLSDLPEVDQNTSKNLRKQKVK